MREHQKQSSCRSLWPQPKTSKPQSAPRSPGEKEHMAFVALNITNLQYCVLLAKFFELWANRCRIIQYFSTSPEELKARGEKAIFFSLSCNSQEFIDIFIHAFFSANLCKLCTSAFRFSRSSHCLAAVRGRVMLCGFIFTLCLKNFAKNTMLLTCYIK